MPLMAKLPTSNDQVNDKEEIPLDNLLLNDQDQFIGKNSTI